MAERMKLTILTVKGVKPIGDKGAAKLSFFARNKEGKEFEYFTFSKRLFGTIRGNIEKEIEADVEVTERPTTAGSFIDRKVTEIYIDGKPVAQQGGGGRQWGGKSPEEIASIEAQVAAKLVVELLIAGKLEQSNPIVDTMKSWITLKLKSDACLRHAMREALDKVSKGVSKASATPKAESVQGSEAETPGQEEKPKSPLERFKDECLRKGWDTRTEEGGHEVAAWLKARPGGKRWNELSAMEKEAAIEEMRRLADKERVRTSADLSGSDMA